MAMPKIRGGWCFYRIVVVQTHTGWFHMIAEYCRLMQTTSPPLSGERGSPEDHGPLARTQEKCPIHPGQQGVP